MREQLRPKTESESEERKKAQKEYLKWWLGKKK
jgi:hypothetical protein